MSGLGTLARHLKVSVITPWSELDEQARTIILYGSGDQPVTMRFDDGQRKYHTKKPFEGVIPNMERRYRETDSAWIREELARYHDAAPCDDCQGFRLKPEARAVKIDNRHIGEVSLMSISQAAGWFSTVAESLTAQQREIAQRILKEINERLGFLVNVGLEYLTLSRHSGTLSGGESQRIRLASQIGSGSTSSIK